MHGKTLAQWEGIHFLGFFANFRFREVEGGGSRNHGEERREDSWMCVYAEIEWVGLEGWVVKGELLYGVWMKACASPRAPMGSQVCVS